MSATKRSRVRTAAAATAALFAATSAWAQDYTATAGATGQYLETRPAGATLVNVTSSVTGGAGAVVATLPFAMPYYGQTYSTTAVTAFGALVLGATSPPVNVGVLISGHGQNASTGGFPYASTGDCNGLVAVHWTNLRAVNDGTPACGFVYTWTTGVAPSRHVVYSWENVDYSGGNNQRTTFQTHLYETTGRVIFSYSNAWPTTGITSWIGGLDSPIDARFSLIPGTTASTNGAYSGADVVFDPASVTYVGRALFDRPASDASGIGNSTLANQPLAGLRVELRRNSDQYAYGGAATTGADGGFSVTGIALPSASAGSLVVVAQSAGAVVVQDTSTPAYWTIDGALSFASGANVGTATLGVGADPTGDLRAAMNVARACGAAASFVAARSTAVVPPLQISVGPTASGATQYQAATGVAPASARVGWRASANVDAWDDAVVTKLFARHVLAATVGAPVAYDGRFDAATDPENAFAEGFGAYLWAAVSGASTLIDGASSSSATVYDLESPTLVSAKGPAVGGWVAAALFDLLDPANETTDPVDGTAAPERPLLAALATVGVPRADSFLKAWIDAGYDAPGATRVFVGDGVVGDDAFEPNDVVAERSPLGDVGFVRTNLVLQRFNEDWFAVALPVAAPSLRVDATYDRFATGATVAVEIRDAGDALLATGAFLGATGTVHAQTSALAAGTYRVRVQHVSGKSVPAYSLQAFVAPSMDAKPVRDWTVGRAYDAPLGLHDGIAPFTLSTPSSSMPPGLVLDAARLRAVGTPTAAGVYELTVQATDAGSPSNIVTIAEQVVVHDVFKLPIAPFVGFPAGKTIDATLPTQGGTSPFTLTTSSGALTSGLAFAPNSLHVTGTATLGPSSAFELDGVDVAGSADHVATRAVVAVEITGKKIPANLAAGADACGWWIDAVEGGTVTFAVATGKGQPKRALTGAFLAPDRSLVTTGKIVGKLGAIAASKLICPQSGRYYFVASTTDAGLATQLLGTATVTLPKSGKGLNKAFAPSATTAIEFGAVPGSTATVKFAGDKRAGLVAKVVSVTDPNGVPVPGVTLATLIKSTPTGGTLTLAMPVGGTWKVVLGATSSSGTPGKFTYSYALKQLKGAVYSAE